MRLPGYCLDCRRFKVVRVTQGQHSGVCDQCEEEQDVVKDRYPKRPAP